MEYIPVGNKNELDDLLGRESHYRNFTYRYELPTIELLKSNFDLPDSLYLWVKDQGKFAGFLSCDRDWWEEDCFFLREIFVDPAQQGKGVGKELINRCIEHARANKAHTLVTQTAFENIPMQKLCELFGFQQRENPQWQEGITFKLAL